MSTATPTGDAPARRPEKIRQHKEPGTPPTRFELLLYGFVRGVIALACRGWFRLEIRGREHLPDGPFVLSPIHRSNLDFAIACSITPRRMRFLGKDTIWKTAWLGRIWDALGAIPVHRGTPDRDALKACVAVVRAGEPLVVFPEGTRQSGPKVHELYDGPAFIQARTGVPIVPVGIGGSEAAMPKGAKFPKPRKVVVVIGQPLPAPERTESGVVRRAGVRAQTAALAEHVQALFDEAQAAAGTPNTAG